MPILVEIENLKKYFPLRSGTFSFGEKKFVHAVDDINLDVEEGETLGLVGESGCGKSTTGKLVLRLLQPSHGTIRFMGRDIFSSEKDELRELRHQMQMIFQDPFASLNPRKTVGQILAKPFLLQTTLGRDEIENKVRDLLEIVGLRPASSYASRYPHEFSGGQRQRIGIARAIALNPKLIVADEPVSSLDMSVRGQILNLLKELKQSFGHTYIFISHDLAVVRSMCQRVAVMYLGKIVELAHVDELYSNPLHPYTRVLLSSNPISDPKTARSTEREIPVGDVSSVIELPHGCRFHTRCRNARESCKEQEPPLAEVERSHLVACRLK